MAAADQLFWRTAVACLLGAFMFLFMGLAVPEPGTDFNQFYAAGKLAGTGHLYDWDRMQELERPYKKTLIPFGRPPFNAVCFRPLSALPYGAARVAWMALNAAALAAFALLWPMRRRDDVLLAMCWSCPAALLLSMGQDTGLFLAIATVGLLLLRANRDFAAGLVWSLCAAKFHLGLGIPVFLAARRKWVAIAGGVVGGLAQLAISFAAEGRGWPQRLLDLAKISEFSPVPYKMPNLNGLTYRLPGGALIEAVLAVLVLAAVWRISRRATLPVAAAAALAGGLLVGHHAYVYDAILLLPLVMLVRQADFPRTLQYWALLLCAPVPYILLMYDPAAPVAQAAISGFALAALTRLAVRPEAALQAAPARPIPEYSRQRSPLPAGMP